MLSAILKLCDQTKKLGVMNIKYGISVVTQLSGITASYQQL